MTRAARCAVALNRRAVERRKPVDWHKYLMSRFRPEDRRGPSSPEGVRQIVDGAFAFADTRRNAATERTRLREAIDHLVSLDRMRSLLPHTSLALRYGASAPVIGL